MDAELLDQVIDQEFNLNGVVVDESCRPSGRLRI